MGWDYTRNPASQIASEIRDNDLYAWTGRENGSLAYVANGLNQYAEVGANDYCYDANGNLTDDGDNVYKYDVENRLVTMRDKAIPGCPDPDGTTGYGGTLLASLHYDPLGRLLETIDGPTSAATQFFHDGDALALEYDGSTILRRYIHGNNATADDPLIWYEGSSTADSNVRNLYADPRGSIVLVMGGGGVTKHLRWMGRQGLNQSRPVPVHGAGLAPRAARRNPASAPFSPPFGPPYS